MIPQFLIDLAAEVIGQCRSHGVRVATAESCTGGLVCACLTAVPGSSAVLERGFTTYSNEAKIDCLGVPTEILADHGAVSAQVAEAMAAGALAHSLADIAVAITGVAGPDGGSVEKPVGLVYLGIAKHGATARHERHLFVGDRTAIRLASVERALTLLLMEAADTG